jgi:hypothetical protein
MFRLSRVVLLHLAGTLVLCAGPLDNWTVRDSGVSANLWDIAYANNTFVVVGDQGTILTSEDVIEGVTKVLVSFSAENCYDRKIVATLCYGRSRFFTVGCGA